MLLKENLMSSESGSIPRAFPYFSRSPCVVAGAVRAKKLDLVRFLGTSTKISKYVADIIIRNIGYMHIMPN